MKEARNETVDFLAPGRLGVCRGGRFLVGARSDDSVANRILRGLFLDLGQLSADLSLPLEQRNQDQAMPRLRLTHAEMKEGAMSKLVVCHRSRRLERAGVGLT